MYAGHGVEEMGDPGGALLEPGYGLLAVGHAVA